MQVLYQGIPGHSCVDSAYKVVACDPLLAWAFVVGMPILSGRVVALLYDKMPEDIWSYTRGRRIEVDICDLLQAWCTWQEDRLCAVSL